MKQEEVMLDLVEVEWIDAQSGMYCTDIGELIKTKLMRTYSAGYLIHKDQEKIILAFMLFGEDKVKHHQMIPRKMIKKITYLGEVKK